MPGGQKAKTEARSSIVTKSNKDFKNGPHQKKKKILKTKQNNIWDVTLRHPRWPWARPRSSPAPPPHSPPYHPLG